MSDVVSQQEVKDTARVNVRNVPSHTPSCSPRGLQLPASTSQHQVYPRTYSIRALPITLLAQWLEVPRAVMLKSCFRAIDKV